MSRWIGLSCALSMALSLGCDGASSAGGERGDGSGGDGDGTGSGGSIGSGGTVAPPSGMYFDLDGNPVTTVYDLSGNPVDPTQHVGPLYDASGGRVYDAAGVPASGTGTPGSGVDLGECGAERADAMVGLQGADIIWVVDNSGSMAIEAAAVQANMNRFTQTLVDRGVDVRVVLISSANVDQAAQMMCPPNDWVCLGSQIGGAFGGDYGVCIAAPFGSGNCPDDSKPPNFLHLDQSVGSSNALQMAVDLYPQYAHMMRPNAVKHFAVITDDNSSMTAADFTNRVNALDPALFPEWFFHGIYSFTQCPDAAEPGTVYQQLVQQTGGVAGDLCLQDFNPVFDTLAADVAEKADIACDWPIPAPPEGQTLDRDKVNVVYTKPDGSEVALARIPDGEDCGGREGWFYDNPAEPTVVLACPASCDGFQATGGSVEVLFGCDSVLVE